MPRLTRAPATWLIYALLGLWGYFLYGFGPVVPLLRDEQGVNLRVASLHGTAIAVGALAGGALFPVLTRWWGRETTLWLGITGVAGGVAALTLCRPIALTLATTIVIAVFGTLLLSGVVSGLSALHGAASPAAISEANAICAGMGVIAPLVIGASVTAGHGWRPAMAVLVGLIGLVALVAFLLRVRLPHGNAQPTGTVPAARLPGRYWLAWTLICVTGSIEVSLSLWAAEVLRAHAAMAPGAAAAAVSGIVAGMCLGRIVGSRVALRTAPVPLFLAAVAVSTLGFAVFWLATAPWLASAGLFVVGLGNAMQYPLGISLALRTAPGQEDQAAARGSYAFAVCFGIAPLLLGAVADGVGAHLAFLLVPAMLALAALLALRLRGLPTHEPVDLATAGVA